MGNGALPAAEEEVYVCVCVGGSQSSVEAEAPGAFHSLALPVCQARRCSKWQPWVGGGERPGLVGPSGWGPAQLSVI